MKTRYQLHVEQWSNGCGADICCRAKQVVHARGRLPCDILFIGEAPGPSENVVGIPFVGPAGKLLDRIIGKALPPECRVAFCNIVGCIPLDEGTGEKFHEPDEDSIVACQPRLVELVAIANPRLVICVGKLADKWLKPGGYMHTTKLARGDGGMIYFDHIDHPAFILRAPVANRGLLIQRATVRVSEAYERFIAVQQE